MRFSLLLALLFLCRPDYDPTPTPVRVHAATALASPSPTPTPDLETRGNPLPHLTASPRPYRARPEGWPGGGL